MRLVFRVAAMILLLGVGSCSPLVSAEITTYIDRSRLGQAPYTSAVVAALRASLKERKIMEGAVVKMLADRGVEAVRSIDIAPPTERLSAEEVGKRIGYSGMQVALFINPVGTDVAKSYVPPSYTPPTEFSPGYFSGGYEKTYAVAAYDLEILDLTNAKTVWTAEVDARGNSAATFNDVSRGVAEQVVQRLIEEGFF